MIAVRGASVAMFAAAVMATLGAAATGLAAQAPPRVVVRDSIGRIVPFATIQAGGSIPRTANDSGVVVLTVPRADSLKLLARRIGFAAFEGWVKPDVAGDYRVELNPLPQNLNRVTIFDRDTPLARAGFYDRMERVERGAAVARFWTPEAIDLRNPNRTSVLLEGEAIVRIRATHGKPVMMGRGGLCPVGLIVDGQRMSGMVEEMATPDGQDEIAQLTRRGMSQEQAERTFINSRTSIDEIVNSLAVVAMEIYASPSAIPAELQRNMPPRACGLVVIWTGRRG